PYWPVAQGLRLRPHGTEEDDQIPPGRQDEHPGDGLGIGRATESTRNGHVPRVVGARGTEWQDLCDAGAQGRGDEVLATELGERRAAVDGDGERRCDTIGEANRGIVRRGGVAV